MLCFGASGLLNFRRQLTALLWNSLVAKGRYFLNAFQNINLKSGYVPVVGLRSFMTANLFTFLPTKFARRIDKFSWSLPARADGGSPGGQDGHRPPVPLRYVSTEYIPTIEELYRGEYDVGNTGLVLDILDTSGSYEFPAMRKLAVETGDAFILVYAINDEESFEEVGRLKQLLMEHKSCNAPIVVVGNKCDLEKQRVVQKIVADTIVGIDWEDRFVEASAKDNINIVRIFKEILVQANFPYDLNPAVQKRRTSLPLYAIPKGNNNTIKSKEDQEE
ncbi:dexamethasone-induced Ras-related protein 1 [Caerostris extrusa]|uniref:Dexamethasone-induced Ras-related protein 1 n=1 Tax=Caerostris extrusa TaxID=172846 RepID=A0AAV4QCN6_CAEEX|nr:dexamethasone-induced Ras-related protein 1 [Caerostris extrusa]